MISLQTELRKSDTEEKGTLCVHVSNESKTATIVTQLKIRSDEWDAVNEQILIESHNAKRKRYLLSATRILELEIKLIHEIISKMGDTIVTAS